MLSKKYNRPTNKYELFNLRHASARNVIERIFGVLKRRFRILLLAPEYGLHVQARIPTALCAIHNFIRTHDAKEGPLSGTGDGPHHDNNNNHDDIGFNREEVNLEQGDADTRRDRIAQEMWEDYQRVVAERGIQGSDDEGSDDDTGEDTDEDTDDDDFLM
jgi:hypothetical protein